MIGAMNAEQAKAKLRERYPDWHIWYVPADRGVIWCARPRTYVSADTPALLEAGILSASQPDSKGFDPEGDTPHRVKGS